jgi:hypothetical protein
MDELRDYLDRPLTAAPVLPSESEPEPVSAETELEPDERRSSRPGVLVALAAAVALVVLLAVGWALLHRDAGPVADRPAPSASHGPRSSKPPASTRQTPKSSQPATTEATTEATAEATPAAPTTQEPATPPPTSGARPPRRAAAMRQFVLDYIQAALDDPYSAWERLSPRFQQACCDSSVGRYAGYWNTIADATLRDVVADPSTMQVRYVIRWEPEGRAAEDESVTLGLVRRGDGYLIDYEL